jgi:predicted membrane protein
LLLTLDNMGWVETWRYVRYWPLVVVTVGVMQVLQADSRSGKIFGGVVAFAGLVWTADTVFQVPVDLFDFWPVGLIALGVLVLTRALSNTEPAPVTPTAEPGRWEPPAGSVSSEGPPSNTPAGADQVVTEVAVWAGKQRRNASASFRKAELTAIMGGVELDLRKAATATGEAVVDVFVIWGGVEIWVPPDWAVSNQVSLLMGGAEDKSTGTQNARHRLVVRGFVIMGGLEIKT